MGAMYGAVRSRGRLKDLYSIGYQRLKPADLVRVMDHLGIEALVDVRSVPSSRVPGFSKGALVALLGPRYEWRGDTLGGRPGPTKAGLVQLAADQRRLLLMCMEEAPGDCHRHHAIAVPLLGRRRVLHVYQDEVIEAGELDRAIRDGDEYDCEDLGAA